MIHWLLLLIINELAILGVMKATEPDMIGGSLAKWMRKHAPDWITQPLFDCPYCMASAWGTTIFWLYYHPWISDPIIVGSWIVHVLALCGISYVLLDLRKKPD